MTDRLLRKCPKCHVPFFKVEGCNRVRTGLPVEPSELIRNRGGRR